MCGAEIFFHTNGNGDVVFFDDLGWPWPKHACLTTEDGIKAAYRSSVIREVATIYARPTVIPLPRGLSPAAFDETCADQDVVGVVVRMKKVRVSWAKGSSLSRQRLDALALALFTGTKRALRVYVPQATRVRVGDVVRLSTIIRSLDGRSALWASTVKVVDPEEGDAGA